MEMQVIAGDRTALNHHCFGSVLNKVTQVFD